MSKKKTTDDASKKERESWTPYMDDALIDAFLHQHNMGNRVNGCFTTKAYDNILAELREKFDNPLDKKKVKNRIKTIKSNFASCYDLFNGLSGFGWNSVTNMWDAEPEVWKKLIEAKPKAKEWKKKPMPNYFKLVEIYRQDRATGEHAETASELRQRQANMGRKDFMDTVANIDNFVTQNEVSLESFDTVSHDNDNVISHESHSRAPPQGAISSKAKRRKISSDEKVVNVIKEALHEIAVVMKEGNSIYEKSVTYRPMSEEQVYSLLEDLDVEPNLRDRAYLYLIDHPEKLRALIGVPMERRKNLLLLIMSRE